MTPILSPLNLTLKSFPHLGNHLRISLQIIRSILSNWMVTIANRIPCP
uniref:Uncharacterized protein n=1 Tax=Rhizophora mucronata TaxID=61149 RepID=A0A2P2R3Y5_RHIMU